MSFEWKNDKYSELTWSTSGKIHELMYGNKIRDIEKMIGPLRDSSINGDWWSSALKIGVLKIWCEYKSTWMNVNLKAWFLS